LATGSGRDKWALAVGLLEIHNSRNVPAPHYSVIIPVFYWINVLFNKWLRGHCSVLSSEWCYIYFVHIIFYQRYWRIKNIIISADLLSTLISSVRVDTHFLTWHWQLSQRNVAYGWFHTELPWRFMTTVWSVYMFDYPMSPLCLIKEQTNGKRHRNWKTMCRWHDIQ